MKKDNYLSKQTTSNQGTVFESPVRTYGKVTFKPKVNIGRFSFINDQTTIFTGTSIGRYCSIGKSCEIGAFDHPLDRLSSSPVSYNLALHFPEHIGEFQQEKLNRPEGPIIGNDVWVGSGVLVRRGVTIGHGAAIAANSVVIKDVPPYAVMGGVPAKLIKFRFDESTIARLLELKWWELTVEQLSGVDFSDINIALRQVAKIRLNQSMDEILQPKPKEDIEPRLDFFELLEEKMLSIGIKDDVASFIKKNRSKLYYKYNNFSVSDQQVLNNKIQHIFDLGLTDMKIEDQKEVALQVLRTKE